MIDSGGCPWPCLPQTVTASDAGPAYTSITALSHKAATADDVLNLSLLYKTVNNLCTHPAWVLLLHIAIWLGPKSPSTPVCPCNNCCQSRCCPLPQQQPLATTCNHACMHICNECNRAGARNWGGTLLYAMSTADMACCCSCCTAASKPQINML